MTKGIVKWFHSKKGYGFVTVDGENKDIFVHYSAIKNEAGGFKTLHQNDKVEFNIENGAKGPEAHDVVVTEAAPLPPPRSRGSRRPAQDSDAESDEQ